MNLHARIIDVKAAVFADNDERAVALRSSLRERGIFLVNVMGSPGAGKASLLAALLPRLGKGRRPAVIEADLDSRVDADALERLGWKAVQLRTGGFCHLDACMVESGLAELGLLQDQVPATGIIVPGYNLVFVENIGNLICTAQVDTGAHLNLAVLSVPEGDDKPLKYPVMFAMADIVVISKADYLEHEAFDLHGLRERLASMNPGARLFVVSARTNTGLDELAGEIISRCSPIGAHLSVLTYRCSPSVRSNPDSQQAARPQPYLAPE